MISEAKNSLLQFFFNLLHFLETLLILLVVIKKTHKLCHKLCIVLLLLNINAMIGSFHETD